MTSSDWRTYIRGLNPVLYATVKVYSKAKRMTIGQWVNRAIAEGLRGDLRHKASPCPFCLTTIIDKKTAGIAVITQDRRTYAVYCCQKCREEMRK